MERESNVSTRHYRAYSAPPFAREVRASTTVLFGGLTWRHEALLTAVFENLGYRAQPLPNPSRQDFEVGKQLIDAGACCPTSFTAGNLVNFLRAEERVRGAENVKRDFVYLTAGSCGACRFGQYHAAYEMALRNIGMQDFRLFLLAQDRLEQGAVGGGGLELDRSFTLGVIWAVLLGDLITDLEYRIRPYEKVPGETERAVAAGVSELASALRSRPQVGNGLRALAWHVLTDHFTAALRRVRRSFDAIEVDRLRPKPSVAVTGEFWLETHEGEGNYRIKRWLECEGAEVLHPVIAVWLDYSIEWNKLRYRGQPGLAPGARYRSGLARATQRLLRFSYQRLRAALGGIPRELPPQHTLRELAEPFYHQMLSGGEGYMLVGKALYYHLQHKAHMVCELSPYSCMPNTMSIGSMAQVLGQHPDLLYAPIEVKGDAEVHALSRCQMVLTEARRRAADEYAAALEQAGLSEGEIRAFEASRPGLRSATVAVPHYGAAGTAANYVLHVAALMGRGERRLRYPSTEPCTA